MEASIWIGKNENPKYVPKCVEAMNTPMMTMNIVVRARDRLGEDCKKGSFFVLMIYITKTCVANDSMNHPA